MRKDGYEFDHGKKAATNIVKRMTKAGVRWDVRYRDPSGTQRKKSFRRKTDADTFLNKVRSQVADDDYIDPKMGKVSFKDYAEQWRVVQPHRQNTAELVEGDLRLHCYPIIGHRQLRSIQPDDLKGLIKTMAAKLEPATVKRVYQRVGAVFASAVDAGRLRRSPCTQLVRKTLPKVGEPDLDLLTVDEVWRLADAMPDRYRAYVIVGAGSGLRPGEMFGLTRDRLVSFLSEPAIKVDRQLLRVRGAGLQFGPPKFDSYRTVPIDDRTKEVLAEHIAKFPNGDGFVFTNTANRPINAAPFLMVWHKAREKAGIPDHFSPHDLRHFYASLLIRQGLSVKAVQSRLGHKSATVTLDTYGKLWPDDDDRTRLAVVEGLWRGDGEAGLSVVG